MGVCATARVRLWCLRALVCALAWGWWDNHCPAAPAPLAWLVLTLWCGLEKRVREPVGGQVRGGKVGRDDYVPPLQCGCAAVACAWKRGGAHGVVNTPLSCDRLHGNG